MKPVLQRLPLFFSCFLSAQQGHNDNAVSLGGTCFAPLGISKLYHNQCTDWSLEIRRVPHTYKRAKLQLNRISATDDRESVNMKPQNQYKHFKVQQMCPHKCLFFFCQLPKAAGGSQSNDKRGSQESYLVSLCPIYLVNVAPSESTSSWRPCGQRQAAIMWSLMKQIMDKHAWFTFSLLQSNKEVSLYNDTEWWWTQWMCVGLFWSWYDNMKMDNSKRRG